MILLEIMAALDNETVSLYKKAVMQRMQQGEVKKREDLLLATMKCRKNVSGSHNCLLGRIIILPRPSFSHPLQMCELHFDHF